MREKFDRWKKKWKLLASSMSVENHRVRRESSFILVNAQYERSPVELFGEEAGSALRANDLRVIQCLCSTKRANPTVFVESRPISARERKRVMKFSSDGINLSFG
jgi:hypothetical protein